MTSITCLPDSPTTESLLPLVAAGDEDAVAALWSTYEGRIRGLARRLSIVSPADTDDIVQDTLTKVWKSAHLHDPERGTEATFVFTIARRVIIDRWRKAARRPIETRRDDALHFADHRAADPYESAMVSSVVDSAVRTLSTLQREVIELAYTSGLSQSEIAQKLDVPLGTVKTRTFAALRTLRRTLVSSDVLA